ncbi:hypothetical protein NUSPORA_02554 [Nucleospora cyclopteri]
MINRRIQKEASNKSIGPKQVQQNASDEIKQLYKEGKQQYERGDTLGLKTTIEKMEEINEQSSFVHVLKSFLLLHDGNFELSYESIKKYLELTPSNSDPYALECMTVWNMLTQNYKTAIKQFNQLLSKTQETQSRCIYLMKIAICKKKLGFYHTADDILNRVLAIPEGYKMYPLIKLEAIHILILRKKFDEAQLQLKLFPCPCSNSLVNRLHAYTFYAKGWFQEVLDFCENTPKDVFLDYLIIRTRMLVSPGSPILNCYFQNIIKISPNNPIFFNTYGNYLVSRGCINTAMNYYKRSMSLDPLYSPAYKNLKFITENFNCCVQKIVPCEHVEGWNLRDIEPEVEACGFFNTHHKKEQQKVLQSPSFYLKYEALENIPHNLSL